MTDILSDEIMKYLKVNLYHNPVDCIVHMVDDEGDYLRLLISYEGADNDEIPAFLLLPKGEGPFPALIIHHQHNGERHLGKSEVCGLIGDPFQAFGTTLVKKGFIVLAPDSICFEDRRKACKGTIADDKNDWLQHFNEMCYRIINGDSLMRKVLEDASIGVSLLYHNTLVDKNRIGTLGHSYGGNTVIFLSALDQRIKFSCSSGAACTFKEKMINGTGIEMAEVIPGFAKYYDIEDLIKCAAPNKFLIVSATDDKYSKDAEDIELNIKQHANDEENHWLEHKRFKGGHSLNQERFDYIVNWINNCAI
jgi:dienelactone hydrolase